MNQNLSDEHRKNWDVLSIFQYLYQQQSISMLFILIIMWVILSLLSPYFLRLIIFLKLPSISSNCFDSSR